MTAMASVAASKLAAALQRLRNGMCAPNYNFIVALFVANKKQRYHARGTHGPMQRPAPRDGGCNWGEVSGTAVTRLWRIRCRAVNAAIALGQLQAHHRGVG